MIDYISNSQDELLIQNGDFVQGESDLIHSKKVLIASPGEIRNDITLGLGINSFIGSSYDSYVLNDLIRRELDKIGIVLNQSEITMVNNNVSVKLDIL